MADTKITGMTAATALARADLVAVVQDVATTPVNRKATLDVLDPGNVLRGAANDATVVIAGDATGSTAGRYGTVIIGIGANGGANDSTGEDNVVIGRSAATTARRSVVIGQGATGRFGTVVVGRLANSTGDQSVAIGLTAKAALRGVAIGSSHFAATGAQTTGSDSIAVGVEATAAGDACALGKDADATAAGSIALGKGAVSSHAGSVAIGLSTATTTTDQVMVGPRDIEITGIVKGLVLVDRTLGTRHRVYLDNGALSIEAA